MFCYAIFPVVDVLVWCCALDVLVVLDFEFLAVEQNSIQYAWQVIFSYVSVKDNILDLYEVGFFDGSGKVEILPANNFEVFH